MKNSYQSAQLQNRLPKTDQLPESSMVNVDYSSSAGSHRDRINFNGELLIATPAQVKVAPLVSLMLLLSHFSLYLPSLIIFDYIIVFLIFFNFNPF